MTRMYRRQFVAGAAAATVIAGRARAQSKPIKLAWIRQFAPAALVQKEVDLAKADGLTVELVGFNRGLDGMIALQKGDAIGADCLVGYSQFALALSQGIDLTAIAGSCLGLNAVLISPRGIPKEHIDDKNKAYIGPEPWKLLAGKTVGTARGSQNEFTLRSYMTAHGMDFDKQVKFIDLKTNADQVLALQQGNIDVAALVEPSATQARMAGYGVLLCFPYDAGEFAKLNSALLVRTDAIKQYPNELQILVNAHVKAMNYYQANRGTWASDTAKVTLFDVPTMQHLMDPKSLGLDPKYWTNIEFSPRLPAKAIAEYAKSLFAGGILQKDVSGDIAAHLDYSFLEKATQMSASQLGG